MANYQCDSCEQLRQDHPDFIINGFSDENCESISDNKGLDGKNDNCEDLHNMNDCMIGMMENEVKAYETCDWKKFMRRFIPNVWTLFKGIICWLCGLQCKTDILSNGVSLTISEEDTGQSHIIAGKGISFLGTGTGYAQSQVKLLYIAGGLVRVQGSLLFNKDNFTDADDCYNYDADGREPQMSTNKRRLGNPIWNNTEHTTIDGEDYYRTKPMVGGGELLYEIRISKEQYPFIKGMYAGNATPTGGGAYQVNLSVFSEGEWAYGQHGRCNEDGVGEDGHSNGHKVPAGWIYVQARMVNITYLNADGFQYSPRGFMGIRVDTDGVEC